MVEVSTRLLRALHVEVELEDLRDAALALLALIDDTEYAQDSLRHSDEAFLLRELLGVEAPWDKS